MAAQHGDDSDAAVGCRRGDEDVRERVERLRRTRASEAASAAARSDVDVDQCSDDADGHCAVRAATTAQDALSSAPASMPTKNNPKPSAATIARPVRSRRARGRSPPARSRASRCRRATRRSRATAALPGSSRARVDRERHDRCGRRDGRDDPHRSDGEAAIESADADQACDSRTGGGQELDDSRERFAGDAAPRGEAPRARRPARRRARRGRPGAARRALRRSRRRPSTRAPPSASSAVT